MSASPDNPITVTLLGTGTPQPDIMRYGSAMLVQAGGLNLLFDAGRGASLRLTQAGVRLRATDAVFLTHFHSDHTAGLADVYVSGYIPGPFGKRQVALPVHGPVGVAELTEGLMRAFEGDRRERAINAISSDSTAVSRIRSARGSCSTRTASRSAPLAPTTTISRRPMAIASTMRAFRSSCRATPRQTRALRVPQRDVTCLLVYEVAAIHESMAENAFFRDVVMKGHTSPEEAARIFSEARAKLAVFTHIVQLPGGTVGPSVATILSRTGAHHDGQVLEGCDLMTIRIGSAGVRAERPAAAPAMSEA